MSIHQSLLNRLNDRSAVIGIIGLGYVGLPLAVEFAAVGYTVIGYDVHQGKVDSLNRGESYIPDIPTEQLAPLVASGKLRASTDVDQLKGCDAISICVPTPLRKTKDPDMSYVIQSIDDIARVAHPGLLIILESTTYPGTTVELIVPRMTSLGYTVGTDVFVSFSPERIDPGNQHFGVRNTPKVVGGVTDACNEAVIALYSAAVNQVVRVSSPTAAEMVKLLENTFRAVNIGLVNEMALMCDKLGVDVWEVIRAASTKPFGFMPFYPGPGLGGHCIPVDPHYLSWKLKALNYTARFIELASEVNTSMPVYVVDKVMLALNDDSKALRGANVVVLGVAYKKDIDDVRESPAIDIIGLLRQRGANVQYHDPYVPQIRLDHDPDAHHAPMMQSAEYGPGLLEAADCVVIVTDHSTYDWQQLADHSKLIVDTRNAMHRVHGRARVTRL